MLKSKAPKLNDGIVKIYEVGNSATPGEMPQDALVLKETLRYENRMVGITRYQAALQSNYRVDALIRCPRRLEVTAVMIAVPNDGLQYDVKRVSHPPDIYPPVMDLELMRRVEDYAVENEEEPEETEEPEDSGDET